MVCPGAILIFAGMTALGQTPSPSPTNAPSPSPLPSPAPISTPAPEPIDVPPPVDYFIPDLSPTATAFENKAFNLRVGFAVLADYHFIGQNAISRGQVGPQASVF